MISLSQRLVSLGGGLQIVPKILNDKQNTTHTHIIFDSIYQFRSTIQNSHLNSLENINNQFYQDSTLQGYLWSLEKKQTPNNIKKLTQKIMNQIKQKTEQQILIQSLLNQEQQNIDLMYYLAYYNQENKYNWNINDQTQPINQLNITIEKPINENIIIWLKNLIQYKNQAKYLTNLRADQLTPFSFIEIIKKFAIKKDLNYKVFFDDQLKDEQLNLIYAVGKGSINKPGFIVVEYSPIPHQKNYTVLIGKGVTFDTGGNNLKSTGHIEDMYIDKAGACAVFSAFQALVNQEIKHNILLAIPLAENSCDGNAIRPSDVIKSYKGITVEITNTDAEGRLILADAMSYVQSNYKVDKIIELSTLTGACMVALGTSYAGLFTNSWELKQKLQNHSGKFDEKLWHLPLDEGIYEGLKGQYSDIVNSTEKKYGGAIEGAEFLRYFVDKQVQWCHIDMAGVATDHSQNSKANSKLASGFGVSTILGYFDRLPY